VITSYIFLILCFILPDPVEDQIKTLVSGPDIEPSSDGLKAHISDLETDLRNTEFRLQFLYHQRNSTLELLKAARRRAGEVPL
jgi:hypothetical protein